MSFLTWRWLLPQKLQRSCSLPSLARAISQFRDGRWGWPDVATRSPCTSVSRVRLGRSSVAVRHDHIDDAVILGFLRGHEVIAIGVPADLLEVLPGVLGEDL